MTDSGLTRSDLELLQRIATGDQSVGVELATRIAEMDEEEEEKRRRVEAAVAFFFGDA